MSEKTTSTQLTLFAEVIPAPHIPERGQYGEQNMPISPDTSLPWSDDYAHDGWSARMFLHQLLSTSMQHWQPLDTERLLSEWTPRRLRANLARETSLSDAIKPPGQTLPTSFRTPKMVRGLIRRALARGRSLRLLLRTEHDTIPVIVTFTKADDYGSWTATSAKALPASLRDGLLDFLRQHAPECVVTPLSRKSQSGLDEE